MNLIFIRHAEPDYARDSLTEKGWREAELLAARTAKWDVAKFYTSPLGRARATAQPTLDKLGRTAEVLPWAHEFDAPVLDPESGERRIPWDLLPAYWTEQRAFYDIDAWTDTPLMRTGPVAQEYAKVCAGLDELLARHGYARAGRYYRAQPGGGDTIVLFCHLGVMMVMLAHLLGATPLQMWHGFFVAPSSVTVLSTEERAGESAYFRCQMLGDTGHLRAGGEPVSHMGSYAREVFQG